VLNVAKGTAANGILDRPRRCVSGPGPFGRLRGHAFASTFVNRCGRDIDLGRAQGSTEARDGSARDEGDFPRPARRPALLRAGAVFGGARCPPKHFLCGLNGGTSAEISVKRQRKIAGDAHTKGRTPVRLRGWPTWAGGSNKRGMICRTPHWARAPRESLSLLAVRPGDHRTALTARASAPAPSPRGSGSTMVAKLVSPFERRGKTAGPPNEGPRPQNPVRKLVPEKPVYGDAAGGSTKPVVFAVGPKKRGVRLPQIR